MNDVMTFTDATLGTVRGMYRNDDVWFVGKDVADIIGYQNGSRDINRHVDEEDRHKLMIFDGNQDKETIIINESGLYSLILSSKMPNAKKFKRWVTSEVLPAIRKHGTYSVKPPVPQPVMKMSGTHELLRIEYIAKAITASRAALEDITTDPEVIREVCDNIADIEQLAYPEFIMDPSKTKLKDLIDVIKFMIGFGNRIKDPMEILNKYTAYHVQRATE